MLDLGWGAGVIDRASGDQGHALVIEPEAITAELVLLEQVGAEQEGVVSVDAARHAGSNSAPSG